MASVLKSRVDGSGADVGDRIQSLGKTLDAGIALKRRIIEDLRPSSLDNLGLQRALEISAQSSPSAPRFRVQTEIADVHLDPERALAIYRVVQEALTNVAKYAQAKEVRVLLERVGERARLCVQDDGRGFDPALVRDGGHGLAGMRFRLRLYGGDLVLHSVPGQGRRSRRRFLSSGDSPPSAAGSLPEFGIRVYCAQRRTPALVAWRRSCCC